MSKGSSVQHVVSASDWDDFIAVCYFGGEHKGDWLNRCIRRAYLDMSRTLHGMAVFGQPHPDWQTSMACLLKQQLRVLTETPEWTQKGFDSWHEACVASLQQLSDRLGYAPQLGGDGSSRTRFTVGQAQKWINMSIKYAIALGERRVPGFHCVYDVAHVALDNVVLERLTELGMSPLGCAWSRLDEYNRYMQCQQWVRDHFRDERSLEVEYQLWQSGLGNAGESGEQKEVNDG
jgi:hypothetical protein